MSIQFLLFLKARLCSHITNTSFRFNCETSNVIFKNIIHFAEAYLDILVCNYTVLLGVNIVIKLNPRYATPDIFNLSCPF